MHRDLSQVIEHRSPIPHLDDECSVKEALSFMTANKIDYLPIVNNNHLQGIITFESIIKASFHLDISFNELDLTHVTVKIRECNPYDDLSYILREIDENGAIGLIDYDDDLKEDIYIDLITLKDTTLFLYKTNEDLMMVENIEIMIKGMIKQLYSQPNGILDQEALKEAIKRRTSRSKSFDKLTLGAYILILVDPERWEFFYPYFKLDPDNVESYLSDIVDIRNHKAHFRGEITRDQRNNLNYCLNWFTSIYTEMMQNI